MCPCFEGKIDGPDNEKIADRVVPLWNLIENKIGEDRKNDKRYYFLKNL